MRLMFLAEVERSGDKGPGSRIAFNRSHCTKDPRYGAPRCDIELDRGWTRI